MQKPRVCILRTAGTNCDKETAFSFLHAGAKVELVHINKFLSQEESLHKYEILAFPGGFSYGDDIAAGKILANELKNRLVNDIRRFIQDGKLIIGICNGFQILVKAGLLPGNPKLTQEASLIINDSGKFEDRWVYLKTQDTRTPACRQAGKAQVQCPWVRNLPEVIYLPVAHGEGKFVIENKAVLERLIKNGQIVFQYCDGEGKFCGYPHNPNGSTHNIAGICDETGRIFGLMPHPERHIFSQQHPRWTGIKRKRDGDGLVIFRNGVEYAKKNI